MSRAAYSTSGSARSVASAASRSTNDLSGRSGMRTTICLVSPTVPATVPSISARRRLASSTLAVKYRPRRIVVREATRPQTGSGENEAGSAGGRPRSGRWFSTGSVPGASNSSWPTERVPVRSVPSGEERAICRASGMATVKAPPAGMGPESKRSSLALTERGVAAPLSNTTLCPATAVTTCGSKPAAVRVTWTGSGISRAGAALATSTVPGRTTKVPTRHTKAPSNRPDRRTLPAPTGKRRYSPSGFSSMSGVTDLSDHSNGHQAATCPGQRRFPPRRTFPPCKFRFSIETWFRNIIEVRQAARGPPARRRARLAGRFRPGVDEGNVT